MCAGVGFCHFFDGVLVCFLVLQICGMLGEHPSWIEVDSCGMRIWILADRWWMALATSNPAGLLGLLLRCSRLSTRRNLPLLVVVFCRLPCKIVVSLDPVLSQWHLTRLVSTFSICLICALDVGMHCLIDDILSCSYTHSFSWLSLNGDSKMHPSLFFLHANVVMRKSFSQFSWWYWVK